MDKILKSINELDMSDMKLPMITLYDKPLDYPEHFVARVWECAPPEGMKGPLPTNAVILYPSREAAEKDLSCFTRLERSMDDDERIIAAYLP